MHFRGSVQMNSVDCRAGFESLNNMVFLNKLLRKRPHRSGALCRVRWSGDVSGARPRHVRVRVVNRFSALQTTGKNIEMAANASTASVLNYYFMATTKLVQAKVLKVEDLIALFSDLSSVISYKEAKLSQDIYNAEQSEELSTKEQKLLKKNKKELKTLGDVKTNLEKTLAPHATCEKLVELYAKNFEQNKQDVASENITNIEHHMRNTLTKTLH